MAPAAISPLTSGTSTPKTAGELTQSGIAHAHGVANGHGQSQAPLDASRMTTTLTAHPRAVPEPESAETRALKTCTDHMVTARWTIEAGWDAPELKPYGPLALWPTASVLHYATECFEGLKLYRGFDGRLRLFRVGRNCERMRRSAARIALPDFDPRELEKLVRVLCARDGPKWLPADRAGSFLYLRPTMIATDAALGVQRPREALLYVIMACFPVAPGGFTTVPSGAGPQPLPGMKLLASEEDTIRAWPGGFGNAKVGANYGPSLVAQGEARARGFHQVLWLYGAESYVTEAGASNFFIVMRAKDSGKVQLITAPLGERIILEGVTRASVLQLAQERFGKAQGAIEGLEVVERRFTMSEIIEAQEEGRLIEAFAAGTAVFIAPVSAIHFRGRDIDVPMDGDSGVYARALKQWLTNIMYGKEAHEWGVVVDGAVEM